ncbi:uncharacterized protein LOC142982778, partial [Anticarsia gemmatalis]|uniref:uncharacterized protein LOC142982778 n=1 Tax=Anticarsia gemmatalis TaxID=129554 RepID=UPI003F757423
MAIFMLFNLNTITVGRNFKNLTVSKYMFVMIILNAVLYASAFLLFYILNVIQSRQHVEMILHIQKAFRIVDYKNYKKYISVKWGYILRNSGAYFMFLIAKLDIFVATYFFSLVYFDVNLTYARTITDLIIGGLSAWKSELQYHTKRCLELNVDEEEIWKDLWQAYSDLMEAFNIFKTVFQISVR